MKIGCLNLWDFIHEEKVVYWIPPFQRSYVWTKKNWSVLLEDLIDSKFESSYYFGTIMYVTKKIEQDETVSHRSLIDGQQRLITLLLLNKAIYLYYYNYKSKLEIENYEEIDNYINDFNKPSVDIIFSEGKIFNITKNSMTDFLDILEKDFWNNVNKKTEFRKIFKENILYEAFYYFYSQLDSIDSVKSLINGIYKLTIGCIETYKEDNPQLIFDSINARGVSLTDIERINNYVLLVIGKMMTINKEISEKLLDVWNRIKENVIKKDSKSGKIMSDLNIFIRLFLIFYKKMNIPASQIYNTFRSIHRGFQDEDIPGEKFLSFLEKCLEFSEYYAIFACNKIISTSKINVDSEIYSSEIKSLFLEIKKITATRADILLLVFCREYVAGYFSLNQLKKSLNLLKSYLIRLCITQLERNLVNFIIASIFKPYEIWRENSSQSINLQKDCYSKIREKFLSLYDNLHAECRFLSNEDFKYFLKTNNLQNSNLTKMLLLGIENSRSSNILFETDLAIDYIFPKKPADIYAANNNLNNEQFEELKKNYLYNLGNFVLIWKNSKKKNIDFSEKIDNLSKSSFFVNKGFFANKTIKYWNKDRIENRCEWLIEQAISSFPIPEKI